MRIPRHIGIIPDGNRRWAKSQGLKKENGYDYGLNPGLQLLRQARDYGVSEITYYGFTVDNCKRPKEQIRAFREACVNAVELIGNDNVCLNVLGDTESKFFPTELLKYTGISSQNSEQGQMKVNFLVNYGWEWDFKNGWVSKDIPRMDMVIRWGGMCRLSGFLPIQSVYSDLYIIKDLWPDYKKEHFVKAMEWYQKQDATLGG